MTTEEQAEISVPTISLASSRPKLLGGLVATSTVTAWLALLVNRFFTIHEGWFSYYGLLMKQGKFPYRDFYFFTQPLHLMLASLVVKLDSKLIYYRYYGLCERVLITSVLYYILSRSFSVGAAICGTVASSIIFTAYPTDAYSSYLYTCLLFMLVSVACLHRAWTSPRRQLWLFLTGIAAGLSFFSKQSNGLLAIGSCAVLILFMSDSVRRTVREVAIYSAGVIAACAPFVFWLMSNGAWQAYVSQVFLGAASSKGGLRVVLTGFLSRQINSYSVAAFLVLAGLLWYLLATKRLAIFGTSDRALKIPETITLILIPLWFCVMYAIVHQNYGRKQYVVAKADVALVNVMLYSLPLVLAYVVYRRLKNGGVEFAHRQAMPIALLVTSFFWTYGCGMSWNVGEQSLVPSLSLALAFSYDRLQFKNLRAVSAVILLASLCVISIGIWRKWSVAFSWEGWLANVAERHITSSKFYEISDYRLSESDVNLYDSILADISKNVKPGESIVTFPTIPLFNFIGNHPQPTFAPVHYWDVCPDPVARADAKRVWQAKPKMIVELKLADWVWKEHDEGWRGGRRSGQRDFQDTLDALTCSGEYKMLDNFETPGFKMNVEVWLREPGSASSQEARTRKSCKSNPS